jgi:hypothetical protein
VLSITGEGEVILLKRSSGPDLRGLLPEKRCPEAQFTLTLKGCRLGVNATDHHEILVEGLEFLGPDISHQFQKW